MKCAKCGAELKVGCIYCSACGQEAQIVSDYNILEDELLTSFMNEETDKKQPQSPPETAKPHKKSSKPKKKKKNIVPFIIGGIAAALILTLVIIVNVRNQRNNSFDYQYTQGILAKNSGDYTKAITYLKRALELDDDNPDVMMELAKLYQKRDSKNWEEEMLLKILANDKQNRQAYTMLIELYDSQKKYDKIISMYEALKDTSLKSLFLDYITEPPKFSEVPGTYEEEMELEISAGSGEIYYTIGDADPVTDGQKYVSAIKLTEGDTRIQAVVKDSRGIYSDVISGEYRIRFVAPSEPQVTPRSGSYTEERQIVITVPADCTAYYTWDDTTPTRESARYEGPLQMPEGNNVLTVIVFGKHDLSSRVVKYNYIYLPQ